MINGINSYSSYNYTNTFSNNTSNIKSSNVANDNSSLVSDKSRAVSKMLGYGVDKDGFFTSDFNEAAGLPKDYKIYAKDIENFVNIQTKSLLSSYINIDIAKSIGNAYKVFSQLLNDELNNKINFTKEDLVKIPQGFEFNQNTLEINKKYNLNDKEYKDFMSNYQNYSPTSHNIKIMTFFSLDDKSDIFKYSLIDPTPYSNNDKTITKSGIFMTFFTGFQAKNYFIEGQTSILGFDKTMSQSEIDNLNKFISENSMNFKGDIFKLFDLLNSDMSIDDFKQKILEQKENLNNPTKNTNNKETSEEDKKKPFKPIQAQSSSETYKDDNKMNELLKKLLENKFGTSDELELLFGMKFSDDNTGEFNKIISQNTAQKSIDIKA
ncbi:Cj0814 family flagellar-dependent secreted protein [Campylobacter jejuni]